MYHIPGATNDPAYGIAAKAFSINYLKALYDKPGAWRRLVNFDADVSAYGESVTIPVFPRLTAQDASLTDGTYTAEDTSITPATILINKYKVVGYKVPDNVLLQSKINVQTAFAEEAARAVSDSIDGELVELIPSLTRTAGSLGSDLTEAYCLAALQSLVTYHVDLSNPNDFVWVLPASQFAAVHGLKSYTSYTINAGSSNAEGMADVRATVDTLFGFPVHFRSDSAMTVSGGKVGGLFYRDSVGVAIQRMPSMRAPLPIAGTINTELQTRALFGIAILKNDVAVKMLCK